MIVYHANGSSVRMRFLITDGSDVGATGLAPVILIKRRSDSRYWTGAAWQVAAITLAMIEESAADLPGSYYYDFDHTLAGGGSEEYLVRYYCPSAPPLRGTEEEQHIFRPVQSTLAIERRLGHVLSDDGTTYKAVLWIEEGGVRATNYDSVAAQILDATAALIVDLGTDSTDTSAGTFYFSTAASALSRNTPYVLTVQATRGVTTDSFNVGFVRV